MVLAQASSHSVIPNRLYFDRVASDGSVVLLRFLSQYRRYSLFYFVDVKEFFMLSFRPLCIEVIRIGAVGIERVGSASILPPIFRIVKGFQQMALEHFDCLDESFIFCHQSLIFNLQCLKVDGALLEFSLDGC